MSDFALIQAKRKRSIEENLIERLADGLETGETGLLSDYAYDPVRFVTECIRFPAGEKPAPYQLRILETLGDRHRVAVRGPHGMGKSALASWVILWGVLTSPDVKVPTTASSWRQLTKFLWPEVHKWAGRLDWQKIGRARFGRDELLQLNLRLSMTREAFAVASDNPAYIEGAHAGRVIYVFDEAKAIPDPVWDAAEGAFSTGEAYALAISTPGEPQGRFYDIHKRKAGLDDWAAIHVKLSDAIDAHRIDPDWADQRRAQWGGDSAVFQNRVLGEFAAQSDDGIISLADVEAANERWYAQQEAARLTPLDALGIDVARYGEDATVFAHRHGNTITELRKYGKISTMETVGYTVGIMEVQTSAYCVVDEVGVGGGVVDRLNEIGLTSRTVPFIAGERTEFRDRSGEIGFVDMRSAAWWNLREMLEPTNGYEIALPPDDQLIGDLTAPRAVMRSGGKMKVESKDDIRKRIGRSTDCADAVVQAFAPMFLLGFDPFGGITI